MPDEKTPEWKTIVEAKAKKAAELTEKLRAERLARDAASPPQPEPKPRRRAAKPATHRP